MSDGVLLEIAKQLPSAVILFGVIIFFLNHLQKNEDKRLAHDKEMEAMRLAAAKERENERRAFDAQTNSMWANSIKSILDQQERTAKAIAEALADHERNSKERYDKLGITENLLDAVKEGMRKNR